MRFEIGPPLGEALSALPTLDIFEIDAHAHLAELAAAATAEADHARLWTDAEEGNADAQYSVGDLLSNGDGRPRDAELGATFFACAALQGHRDAQLAIARCYDDGVGMARDQEQALLW